MTWASWLCCSTMRACAGGMAATGSCTLHRACCRGLSLHTSTINHGQSHVMGRLQLRECRIYTA